MKKKNIIIITGITSFLFLISCVYAIKNDQHKDDLKISESRPNIIYILADDLGYGDLSCYGQQKFMTPNIDKLAKEGMLFTQHYSGSTVCAPSRSVLMTGMHTGHTVVRGNKEVRPEGQFPIPDSTFIIPKMLKQQGYVTGAFGKWGLGFPSSEGDPTNQGFDTFFGYNCQRLGHHYYPEHLWNDKDSIVIKENLNGGKGVYGPELIHQKTIEFIEKNKDTTFFLYIPSIIPHAELAAPEENMKKYRNQFTNEVPYKGYDEGPEYRQGQYESQKKPHTAFAAMIDLLDQQVGEIMDKVEKLGLSKKTIIIFTSDNGPHNEGGADPDFFNSNGLLRGYKRDLYEGGIRVPMIVKWPEKIKANSTTNQISAFWDVFPTLADITGYNFDNKIDGISFLPTLIEQNDKQKKHDYLYWEFHEKGGRQAIRKGNWKAVRYNVFQNPDAPLELYDLSKDIGEKTNIAAQHPEIIEEMLLILKSVRTSSPVFTFGEETFLDAK